MRNIRAKVLLAGIPLLCTAVAAVFAQTVVDPTTQVAPADGWASQVGGTKGGSAAVTANVYTVSNRTQLLAAISAAKALPKIIKVVGTIDMSDGVPFASHADQASRAELKLTDNTTLIGTGTNAGIVNGFVSVTNISQVIIRNLKIVNPCDVAPTFDSSDGPTGNWNSEFDAITVQGSNHVWIDHNSFTDAPQTDDKSPTELGHLKQCHDGALDIKNGSDYVTVSYNLFDQHSKNNLIGSSDSATTDEGHLTITFSNNVWRDISQRAPRVRFGQVHLLNNYFVGSKTHPVYPHVYSVGAGKAAKILSQNNVFEITGATTCDDVASNPNTASEAGAFKDTGSYLNGKALGACSLSNVVTWTVPYAYTPRPIAAVKGNALTNAGAGKLVVSAGSSSSSSSISSSVASSSSSSIVVPPASSSSSSSVASSSVASSSASTLLWTEPFSAANATAFYSAAYAAQPGTTIPMYANLGGSASTFSGSAITLAGGRFTIGAATTVASTATDAPAGIFDLAGRTCSLTVLVTAASGTANFQVQINNNTTSGASSPLGAASRVVNKAAGTLAIGANVFTWTNVGTSKSFLMLRTESGASVTIDNASLSCSGGAASSSSVSSSVTSSSASSSSVASSAASSSSSSVVAVATESGGFATTKGGNIAGARFKTAASFDELNAIIAAARFDDAGKKVTSGAYPLVITYTGNEDAQIAQIVADHTIDANHNCPNPHWNDPYREVPLKDYTAGITILGADGSSANFGITIVNAGNVVIRNMKIGALAGANNDADMIRIDNSPNVWIDHNELFAVNNECNGSPDSDLTFESAVDIKKDAQNITVSYNYIHDSKKVGLDGSTQSGATTDFQRTITFHHNYYYNVNGRLPLQRGGVVHAYNNLYSKITSSGINVRASGKALIERNYFENSLNPVTCRFDTVGCGTWYLDSNNTTSAASNATYGIVWDDPGTGGINADTWVSTLGTKPALPYLYDASTAQCVKDKLASVAGVGKGFATLTCP